MTNERILKNNRLIKKFEADWQKQKRASFLHGLYPELSYRTIHDLIYWFHDPKIFLSFGSILVPKRLNLPIMLRKVIMEPDMEKILTGLATNHQVAKQIKSSHSQVWAFIEKNPTFAKPPCITAGLTRWRWADVLEWEQSLKSVTH